ncbi:transcription termination factor NusA [Aliarcobacter butzleri]|jgi:N utilization substance protein A|uniref:Transcription termination/antitermination protein NusA n=3 Tax=Aliarcobacter butzleri TaxID=28197 RepID=A8ERE7_ALIB4|nr:transcription termination factor NusA [Aliarcobacter butzleri]ABV66521.1 transcription termination factor NusA [Aliarcobacter butzleri RM4018]AGR76574.1 transcription termination factor [Aliarcobacter butzleri 7h1h]EFU70633.1 transcription termination factor NusA [Aliarcobacter butzleri JV22]KLE03772.1 transcription elongation factor NusA [Aliarcobacter butzleri L352]MCG3665834.1 transcription termination factor NusA [Aliarcobacter butzleri]
MDKIIDILDSIAYEKGLKIDDVENSLKEALIKTAQRMVDTTLIFDANIDRANKKLELFQKIEVVSKDDDRLKEGSLTKEGTPINPENYISLEEAKEINSDLDIGDFMSYELEFENMGRNAATILLSNFEFRLQRFVEENIVGKYKEKVGKTVSGTVTRIDKSDNTYIEIGEIKGILQRKSRIKGEFFKVGDVVKAVVKSVNIDKTNGLLVEISRTSPKFLENLLVLEVPELKDKKIAIEASARIPGTRSKIALSTIDAQIDPIGAVVGVKGVRIGSVSKQLNGENIDCVEYSEIPEIFISRALSPAIVHSVKIEKNPENGEKGKAVVTIPSDQKSKAIGKAGLNIRLASMLTKYDIELIEIGSKTPTLNNETNVQVDEKTTDTASLEALFK